MDIQKGAVFYRRVKNWNNSSSELQEFAYEKTGELLNLGMGWQSISTAWIR